MITQIRNARADDYVAVTKRQPPEIWFGMVAECDRKRVAVGKVEWAWVQVGEEARLMCWASFDRLGEVAAVVVHRRVRQVFKMLREDGEKAVYCYCNTALPTAERWLRRLGFVPMPEITPHPEYGAVWCCDL